MISKCNTNTKRVLFLNAHVQDSESSDQVKSNSSVTLVSLTCHHINTDYISYDADIGPGDGIFENVEIDSEEEIENCLFEKLAQWRLTTI